MGTLSEEAAVLLSILPFFSVGINSQRICSSMSRFSFGRVFLQKEANRKSLELFPFVKMAEKIMEVYHTDRSHSFLSVFV